MASGVLNSLQYVLIELAIGSQWAKREFSQWHASDDYVQSAYVHVKVKISCMKLL